MSYGSDKPIIIWAYNKYIEIINKAIEQYQNINSDTLFEVVEKIPAELEHELDVLIATQGELPNIILVNDQEIERFIKKYPSLFSNLDDYIDKSAFREFKAKNITFRGSIYACPCSNYQEALFYRKDVLMNYLGLEELPEELTWDDYIELGVHLKENGFEFFLPSVRFLAESILQSTGKLYYDSNGVVSSNNVYETVGLMDTLLENRIVCPENTIDITPILDLISNDQLFSIIGTSNLFTRIKELVENNNLTQEWGVSKLPKNDTFCYDVNLGGCSFMVVNNEEIDDDQYYVYDFLTQIFANDNDESCNFYNEVAEYYDMVPSTNYMENKLNDLGNDGCFYDQQVIKFLYDLSENAPGIYYGEYSSELGNEFVTIVEKVVDKTLTISDATTEFDDFCKDYLDLDIPPEVDYIEIETPPNKTIYYEYEVFDRTGMVVRAYFVDGTSSIIKGYIVSPNTLLAGNIYIVVSYSSGDVTSTAEQRITVYTRTVISIEAEPKKQYYLQTDTLSTKDFRVKATFDVGSKDYITEYQISPSTLNQIGNQVVTITYQKRGVTCSCDVTIEVKRKLTSIGVITPPLMVNYIEGQYFNPTGMQVKAYYSDQTSDIVKQYSYTPTTPLEYSEFPQEVQIRYVENGVECETIQLIMVKRKKLERIEIENVRPNHYMAGEYIAESSVTVRAYYNDDTSKIVKDFELLVGKEEPLDEEDTEVEVLYKVDNITKLATYPITVDPKILTSLRIKREPYRLIYEKVSLSNLDLSGLILSMSFNNKIWVDFNYDIYLSNKTSEVKEDNNQNFVSGNDISYEILESKTSKKQVLITYEGKNASFVVTDVGTTLQTMNITKQPNKRRYYVGETFEVDGMEVEGNFLEKKHPIALKPTIEVRDITSACEVDQQPIQPGDKYVYVYYKNDKDEIINHTRVAITVEEKDGDNSKIDQTELTYSCDSGTARVNLFNRRLSFEHFDVSIGANTYTIACSHIYNSLFNEFTSLKYGEYMDDHYKTHMGKGFKLSIQQYLIYDETYERFIYIDSAGYRHYFVSLGDGVRYYDTTGTNLLLKKVKNKDIYKIYDLSGNKMYFENGVIVKSVSCFKNNYAKIYEYDNGKLIKVYDKRKPSNTIIFEYDNETNLLSTIKCTKDDITKKELTYEYVLVKGEYCLSKIIDGDITTIFEYDNSKNLINTYHLETKSCLEFKYRKINNIFLIEEITSGTIDTSQKTIPNNQIIQKNIIESTDDGYKMTVRNQKKSYKDNATDVVMEYQFNVSGYTVSVLEENLGNPYQLKTLEKEPGIEINFPNQSTPDFTINTKNKYKYDNGRMCYSKIYLQNFNELNRYRQGKCNNYDNFTISFWAKLNYVLNDPKILVTIKSSISYVVFKKPFYDEGTAVLDNSAIGVWQYVTVPVKIPGDNINEVTISMALNFWQGVEICDVKLCPSPKSSLNILSKYNNSFASVDNATKIVYTLANSEEVVEKEISDSYFITQDDLKYTILNMYKTSINDASVNDNSFILSMCDGTKKAFVKDASIVINNDGVLLNYEIGLKENSGEESYRALYSYNIDSPDDEMTTSSYLDIYKSRTIGNYTGPVIKGTTIATSGKQKPITSSIYTYADFFGRVLQEVDEYEVTTTYQYNEFGEVTNKTISHSDTDETIEFTTCNTDTTTVEESKKSYNKTQYNNSLGYVESTTYNGYEEAEENALIQTFTYNEDITRLEEVSNNLNGKNVLTYKNNRLSEVTPTKYSTNAGYGYEIDYDRYGNPSKYYLLSGVNKAKQLLTENITDYQRGTITNKQYRQSETESDDVTIHLNKYGKTTSIVENSNGDLTKQTNFSYQNLEESSGAAQVSKMYDPYEDRTYIYSYDEYNKCTGYESISPLGNFNVKKIGPNEVSYFAADYCSRQSVVDYESYVHISPRISYINDIYDKYQDSSIKDIGKVKYTYDELGRIFKKQIMALKGGFNRNVSPITIRNRYVSGTYLNDSIEVVYGDNKGISHIYTLCSCKYDNRGRITNLYANETNSQEFTYDKDNHLSTEKLVSGNTKTYEYNIDGSLKSETTNKDANTKVNYIYEKGRLVQKGNQNYTYDHIGNCLTYNSKNLVWHRGSLLKQYDTTTYSYDNQGVRFRKEKDGKTTIFFHDGGKIIEEDRDGIRIKYLYDQEGIYGFFVGYDYYYFVKDMLGNVRRILLSKMYNDHASTCYDITEVASYDYDIWGNCIVHQLTDDTIDGVSVAEFNPIRWKSHYYDTESGLYYINGRYYSPETKQYLSAQNVETVLSSATTIYGLNLYTPTITNPLDIAPNGYTIETTTELAYDPPELSKWKQFWRSTLGKVVAYFLANIAIAACIITGNIPMLIVSAALLLGSLLIGSIVAGYQSSVKGKSFWRGFARYINDNWAQSVAISSIMIIITIGISAISSGFKSIGSKQGSYETTPEIVQTLEQEQSTILKSYELDPRSIELAKQGDPSFGTFRKRVWQNEAIFNPDAYGPKQLDLMRQGLAPQVDGASMQLHHVVGRKVDLYDVVKLTRTQHISFHKTFGYHLNASWNIENIRLLFG